MALVDLRLQHFRSYDDDSFELSSGVNIIVGPNASGKTNLLESLLLVARGASYRAKDAELIQHGAPWARIDARDSNDDVRTVKLECPAPVAGVCKKSFEIEGKKLLRLSQQKSLPVVLFEPNHLLLLSGSPELRRSYLDDLLDQTTPGFGPARRQYKRVLAQRNALLKQGPDQARNQMFVWNVRLSELAGKIVRERLKLIGQINDLAGAIYSDISRTTATVGLEYVSPLKTHAHPGADFAAHYESTLIRRLEQTFERDALLGYTTAGPHRDDLQVLLNGHVSQETASRGEVRTVILTLKILELQLLREARGQSPLLLLDDVFSELDGARRHALTSFLSDYQTFITTTDADVVVQHFMGSCAIIPMSSRS